jgi:hypothetical protein
MRGSIVITALAFTCGAGVGSWQAASVISSRSKAAINLADMAQRNVEEKTKAAELAAAAERFAQQELALEKIKREAVERALDKALKTKLEDSTREEQTKLDAKVQLPPQTEKAKTRKARNARRIRFRIEPRRRHHVWRRH